MLKYTKIGADAALQTKAGSWRGAKFIMYNKRILMSNASLEADVLPIQVVHLVVCCNNHRYQLLSGDTLPRVFAAR